MRRPVPAVITATLGVLVLAGCADDDVPDLTEVRDRVEQEVARAGDQLDEARRSLEDLGVDGTTRQEAEDAVRRAGEAVEQARDAVEQGAASTGPEAEAAAERARTALDDAEARLDDVAADVDGAARTALEQLADQVRDLGRQLGDG